MTYNGKPPQSEGRNGLPPKVDPNAMQATSPPPPRFRGERKPATIERKEEDNTGTLITGGFLGWLLGRL